MQVSVGGVAGLIAALAFAVLVLRLGSLIGKAGGVLDEARTGVRGLSEQSVPLLSQVTDTVASTNQQIVRVDAITSLTQGPPRPDGGARGRPALLSIPKACGMDAERARQLVADPAGRPARRGADLASSAQRAR